MGELKKPERGEIMSAVTAVYRSRNPQSSDYYRCIEDHFETFIQVCEERFERLYGFFRFYLQKVIDRYLAWGDLHNGFTRIKRKNCGHAFV
jgi:hypothetical protein